MYNCQLLPKKVLSVDYPAPKSDENGSGQCFVLMGKLTWSLIKYAVLKIEVKSTYY